MKTTPIHKFRVVVNGAVKAGCEGPDRNRALGQITLYANHLYTEESPALVQERIGRRWFDQFEVTMEDDE